MHDAIHNNCLQRVKQLIFLKPSGYFSEYLSFAVECGNIEIIKAILYYGSADVNSTSSSYPKSATRVAVEELAKYKTNLGEYCKRLEILYILLKSSNILTDSFGNEALSDKITPLYIAAEHNLIDAVRLLLFRDSNPSQLCTIGSQTKTPIQIAQEQGYQEIAKDLSTFAGCSKQHIPSKITIEIFEYFAAGLCEDIQNHPNLHINGSLVLKPPPIIKIVHNPLIQESASAIKAQKEAIEAVRKLLKQVVESETQTTHIDTEIQTEAYYNSLTISGEVIQHDE